jgi:hypothetical protein
LAIREGLEELTRVVPRLDKSHARSEYLVLKYTVDYLKKVLRDRELLLSAANGKMVQLSQTLKEYD